MVVRVKSDICMFPFLLAASDYHELNDVLLTIPSGSLMGFTICTVVAIIGNFVGENKKTFLIEVETLNSNDIITTLKLQLTILDNGDGKLFA